MKVKVGNKIYDGEKEIIMVILTDKDKENIANMHPKATKYCQYPKDIVSKDEASDWMGEVY